jgi:hypothetical protein
MTQKPMIVRSSVWKRACFTGMHKSMRQHESIPAAREYAASRGRKIHVVIPKRAA